MLQVYQPARTLRSQSSLTLVFPWIKSATYGARCFYRAAPSLLNSLPYSSHIREANTLNSSNSKLKTFLVYILKLHKVVIDLF